MSIIAENIRQVVNQVSQYCQASKRPFDSITLLAVSKTRNANDVREAYQQGLHCFGENYVQEALEKMAQLTDLPIEWHFIGPLQSNKTRQVAESFAWVHSVDRLKIAKRLSEQRPSELPPLNVCLQVNIDDEQSKSGCSLSEALELARQIDALPNVNLRGLMAIPKPSDDIEQQRKAFAAVADLADELSKTGLVMDTLSMGMSADIQAAIEKGSTLLRIGTALFGARPVKSVE